MPNFSFLAGLEVPENFVGVGWGVVVGQVTTMSNLNPNCIELELELGLVLSQPQLDHNNVV